MKNLDQYDKAIETPRYHNVQIAWQCQEGLLSRLEADVFDILATIGSISSLNSPGGENEQTEKGTE